MISVNVCINDILLIRTEAVRIKGTLGQRCTYRTGRGKIITHDYDEGAVALAQRLLAIPDYTKGD